MKNKIKMSLILMASLPSFDVCAADVNVGTGYHFISGDYGRDEKTNVHYISNNLKIKQGAMVYRVTLPFIRMVGPATALEEDVVVGSSKHTTTREGLGDVLASASYVHKLPVKGLSGDVTGRVKLPTADVEQGLGTGKVDYTAQIGLSQVVDRVFLNGTLGRKFNTDFEGYKLRDVWLYSAGAGVRVHREWMVGATYNFRQASYKTSADNKQGNIYASWSFTPQADVQVYVGEGFSRSSPDITTGVQLTYKPSKL